MGIPRHGRVYFVCTDESYWELQGQGKQVLWLHDLFEAVRLDLIKKGLPSFSIYAWRIQEMWTYRAMFDVFPGIKAVDSK